MAPDPDEPQPPRRRAKPTGPPPPPPGTPSPPARPSDAREAAPGARAEPRRSAVRGAAEGQSAARDAAGGQTAARDAAGGQTAPRGAAGGQSAARGAARGQSARRDAAAPPARQDGTPPPELRKPAEDDGPPQYTKYRAGPSLFKRSGTSGSEAAPSGRRRLPGLPKARPGSRLTPRRVVTSLVLAIVGWILLSVVVFLISATVHREGVDGGRTSSAFPLTSATTILVLGSDARTKATKEPGASGPSRADSILLMRIGGGHSSRLSIPRDTVADIPGHGQQKINAAFAFGGAKLMIQTIEEGFGINVDHVVEVNFENFPDLIDAMGGVNYEGGCVVSKINGGFRNGGYTLRLKNGKSHIDGKQALALARTRHNDCNKNENDLTRARRQQKLFSSMKSRLLSPGAFVRLPFISWAAPKSLRSDMGGPTLLGLFGAIATSGTPSTRILKPDGATVLPDGGQALTVSPARRQAAARRFNRE